MDTAAILVDVDGIRMTVPPVSPEEFEELQRRVSARQDRNLSNRVRVSEHLLTGVVKCGKCGMAMFGRKKSVQPNGAIFQPAYYVCEGMKSRGTCGNSYVRQDDLDELVVQHLMRRYGDALERKKLVEGAQQETHAKIRQVEGALEGVRRELSRHDLRLADLREDYMQRKMTLDEYREFKEHVDREFGEHKDRESRLLRQMEAARNALKADDHLEGLAAQLDAWESLTLEQKKTLLAEFIVKVTAYRKKGDKETDVEIVWRQGASEVKEALSVS